jgi:hypothetical protein
MLVLLAALACNTDSDGDGVLDDFDCNPESAELASASRPGPTPTATVSAPAR